MFSPGAGLISSGLLPSSHVSLSNILCSFCICLASFRCFLRPRLSEYELHRAGLFINLIQFFVPSRPTEVPQTWKALNKYLFGWVVGEMENPEALKSKMSDSK